MSTTLNSPNANLFGKVTTPGEVLHPGLNSGKATFVDVNPGFDPTISPSHLLLDVYAVLYGSLANLIVTPPGGRSRIFQEDYFSGVTNLLQEPFDGTTAQLISMTVTTAIKLWEPRLNNVTVNVSTVNNPAGYLIQVTGNLVGLDNSTFAASYAVPVGQG